MWAKFLCVASLACVVWCVPYNSGHKSGGKESPTPYPDDQTPSPFYEIPCSLHGGLCLQKNECPVGKEAMEGLCPMQQDQGVECCYSVGKSSTTCRSRGGECWSSNTKCPDNLTFSKATDCKSDEKCCILIH